MHVKREPGGAKTPHFVGEAVSALLDHAFLAIAALAVRPAKLNLGRRARRRARRGDVAAKSCVRGRINHPAARVRGCCNRPSRCTRPRQSGPGTTPPSSQIPPPAPRDPRSTGPRNIPLPWSHRSRRFGFTSTPFRRECPRSRRGRSPSGRSRRRRDLTSGLSRRRCRSACDNREAKRTHGCLPRGP